MTTTNATVHPRHRDEAAKAAGYRDWTHGFGVTPDKCSLASLRAHAQALANNEQLRCDLEAARTENADLTNRLAGIDWISLNRGVITTPVAGERLAAIHALASGHTQGKAVTPSPCRDCAAKDAEIAIWQGKAETFGKACSEKDEAMAEIAEIVDAFWLTVSDKARIATLTLPYRRPPADPVAEAKIGRGQIITSGGELDVDALIAALAELKSRLGGAK